MTERIKIPEIGSNCEGCEKRDNCRAMDAMRTLAQSVMINNDYDSSPLVSAGGNNSSGFIPLNKELKILGITNRGIRPGSHVARVQEGMASCEGPKMTTRKGAVIDVYRNNYAPREAQVTRRPIAQLKDPEAPKTVSIPVGEGGVIRDLDKARCAAQFQGRDYELRYPDYKSEILPYGSKDSGISQAELKRSAIPNNAKGVIMSAMVIKRWLSPLTVNRKSPDVPPNEYSSIADAMDHFSKFMDLDPLHNWIDYYKAQQNQNFSKERGNSYVRVLHEARGKLGIPDDAKVVSIGDLNTHIANAFGVRNVVYIDNNFDEIINLCLMGYKALVLGSANFHPDEPVDVIFVYDKLLREEDIKRIVKPGGLVITDNDEELVASELSNMPSLELIAVFPLGDSDKAQASMLFGSKIPADATDYKYSDLGQNNRALYPDHMFIFRVSEVK